MTPSVAPVIAVLPDPLSSTRRWEPSQPPESPAAWIHHRRLQLPIFQPAPPRSPPRQPICSRRVTKPLAVPTSSGSRPLDRLAPPDPDFPIGLRPAGAAASSSAPFPRRAGASPTCRTVTTYASSPTPPPVVPPLDAELVPDPEPPREQLLHGEAPDAPLHRDQHPPYRAPPARSSTSNRVERQIRAARVSAPDQENPRFSRDHS
ncbi:pollen-specific leucine-rich repeat extensin-like protein 3 [Iris pallida]|uniref:Pollen-specific leucine-rich repeat extensin-like protein 3 n=1 Tax=Iris pallida TaxID=29817 RepID=A0AAX6GBQ0_IRIPA|nr:pollen-specific leucine-rich repeat extensin-like protein 3 [Iris pallida]